tara:strand:- start:2667 stop:3176 length:510 start_codon:yes stop_codon:yes gene_type:complete
MAITAIPVNNADHFAKGGVRKIEIADYTTGGQNITYTPATNVAAGTLGSNIVTVEFEKESASMAISSTSELTGMQTHTITVEGYIPDITNDKLEALQQLLDSPLVIKVYTWDGVEYLVGWEESSSYSASHTEFPAVLSTLETATGSALSDQNGCSLTFTCMQVHLPATF